MASPRQRRKVKKVMHEYKHGELESGRSGRKVRNPKQAIAIAMSESGQSRNKRGRKKASAAKGKKTGRKAATGKAAATRKTGARKAGRKTAATRSASTRKAGRKSARKTTVGRKTSGRGRKKS